MCRQQQTADGGLSGFFRMGELSLAGAGEPARLQATETSYDEVRVRSVSRGSIGDSLISMTYERRWVLVLDDEGLPAGASRGGAGAAWLSMPLATGTVLARLQAFAALPGHSEGFTVHRSSARGGSAG